MTTWQDQLVEQEVLCGICYGPSHYYTADQYCPYYKDPDDDLIDRMICDEATDDAIAAMVPSYSPAWPVDLEADPLSPDEYRYTPPPS